MTIKNPAALDKAAVSARISDANGWWEVKRNPLSKVGVFPYLGSSLPGAQDPARIYHVLRPAEELADPETINSFKLVPFIDDHTMLGASEYGLTPAEQKGVQGVIGEEVFFDQFSGLLLGNIKVFSEYAVNRIEGGKRELSCGYRCIYDWTPGVFNGIPYDAVQRGIRGNHVALVDAGRMGRDVAVLDHHFTIDSMEHFTMSDEKKDEGGAPAGELAEIKASLEKLTPLLGMVEEFKTMLAGGAPKVEEAIDEPEKKVEETAAVIDAKNTAATQDAKIAKIDASVATLTKLVSDRFTAMDAAGDVAATVTQQIAQRDSLVTRVVPFIGAFDHADKTAAQVATYACDKLGLKPAKGSEIAALDAYLHDRRPPTAVSIGLDAAATGAAGTVGKALDSYLSGK